MANLLACSCDSVEHQLLRMRMKVHLLLARLEANGPQGNRMALLLLLLEMKGLARAPGRVHGGKLFLSLLLLVH